MDWVAGMLDNTDSQGDNKAPETDNPQAAPSGAGPADTGKSTSEPKKTKICPYCGAIIRAEAIICPHCGCSMKQRKTWNDLLADKNSRILLILCAVVLVLLAGVFVNRNVLWGDDRAAYDLMVACADNFKNPDSLRLISGRLGVDKDCMWAKVRAKNGFGSYSTGYYYFSQDGFVLEEEETYSAWYEGKDFNVDKINRIYEKNYG